jgi:DNA polymerase (family 10)
MDWMAPELREDHGEIDAALAHALPDLATVADIRGELHTHTDWTDGRDTLEAMARRAKAKGYEYMAVTDHSPGLGLTLGLNAERIAARIAEARKLNAELAPFRILVGTEVDIRANGTLDYPDEILRGFEIVSASVHSAFGQSREVMTKRILDAMANPYVTAFSHPTGRLLERRDPYDVDLAAVIAGAKRTGTWLEVNGGPERLDLPDVWVRKAIEADVRLVLNSDAHAVEELDWMEYATANSRRGWITKRSIVNALPLDAVLAARTPRP